MSFLREKGLGLVLCLVITMPAWFLGQRFPIVGGPIFGILLGMFLCLTIKDKSVFAQGISFTSKKILQSAVVLLGFGLNLRAIAKTGLQSLPIIISTITISLLVAWILHRAMKVDKDISTLIGVGSSICGGSAVAATAGVIKAGDEDISGAISVIFFFNVIAALIFPQLGHLVGFSTASGDAFGIFSGTAVNDTSSVTAAAATWDAMWNLGNATLDKAVTVKLTRTLAIIPITLAIAYMRSRRSDEYVESRGESENKAAKRRIESENSHAENWVESESNPAKRRVYVKKMFPTFILYFVLAAIITTVAGGLGASEEIFAPLKTLSKFCIVMAMAAVGLNTNIIDLVKNSGKPIFMGLCCWVAITCVSILMQKVMGIW